jgi:hypothetical protein
MQVIIVCRFIPGGRTAVTLTCGLTGYQRRRFVIATAIAAVIWALYAFFIGRLGGKAFEDKPWGGIPGRVRRHGRAQRDDRDIPADQVTMEDRPGHP